MGNLSTICIIENNEINKYKEALTLNINVWVWVLYIFLPLFSSGKHKNKRSKYLNLLRKCYKFQEEHLKENDTGKYVIKWISGMLHMHHQAKWILNRCAHLPMSVCVRVPKWCSGWEKNSEYWLYRFKVTVHKLKKKKRGANGTENQQLPTL